MIKRIGWLNRHIADDYLEKHEMMLGPLYGNLEAHGWMYQSGALRSGKFWGLLDENKAMKGIMARFNDGNCMIHAAEEADILEFVPELWNMRFHTLWMLGCSRKIAERMNKELELDARIIEQYMMLQEELVQGDVGRLQIQDISTDPYDPEYIDAACRILEACFHYKPAAHVLSQRMAERMPEEIYLLGSTQGRWVGQAHIQAWTPEYGHIGGVATLPQYGGRGIARALTGELCRYIHQEGKLPTLTVRKDNTPALKVYRNLGFEPVGEVTVLDTFTT